MPTTSDASCETYVDAALAILGLEIPPASRDGVVLNFQRVAEFASAFLEFPLTDLDEQAPIFAP
jgi:hypothetical protein